MDHTNIPYYPEVEVQNLSINGKPPAFRALTKVRKQKGRKWYLVVIIVHDNSAPGVLNRIHEEAYYALILTKIDPKISDHTGRLLYPADPIQVDERERIMTPLNH